LNEKRHYSDENPLNIIKHKDHLDILKNGLLFEYDPTTKAINVCGHKLKENEENYSQCQPFDEFSHIKSYHELGQIYKAISEKKGEQLNYEMLSDVENCNSFLCKCPSCDICKLKFHGKAAIDHNDMRNCSEKKKIHTNLKKCCGFKEENPLIQDQKEEDICQKACSNKEEDCCEKIEKQIKSCCEKTREKVSSCFCKETKEYHHNHGPNCEHLRIVHNDHLDYIVDGNLHYPHEGHCDNHGQIDFI